MSLGCPLQNSLGPTSLTVAEVPGVRPLSLRANFAWTLVGTGVYGLSQWGMLIVLAKIGSAEVVGRFALGLALCAPVVMFTNLQLRTVQATDARREYSFADYLWLRLMTSAIALVLVGGIVLLGRYRGEVALTILAVGAAKAVESVSDVIYGLWQKHERLDLIAVSLLLRGPASLAALWAIMRMTGSLLWAVLGLVLVWTCLLLSYDTLNARRMLRRQAWRGAKAAPARLRFSALPQLAWLALPLGVVGLLDSLDSNLPRYVVQHTLGEAALGHFAALAYVMVAGNMVVMALAQSAAPRLARYFASDLAAFRRLVWGLMRFGLGLGVVGVLLALIVGRQLLSALYRPEYAAHAHVLVWVMAAAAVGYLARFLVCAMTAARHLWAQAPLYALAALACAAASYWLIPRYGLRGAAWAMGTAMLVLLLGAAAVNLYAVRRGAKGGTMDGIMMTTPEGL